MVSVVVAIIMLILMMSNSTQQLTLPTRFLL
jgi:protein O-GlcNAc transferase